jgi:uncharacterized protein (UPF0333 family)
MRRGQSTVEYLLTISVIVIAIAATMIPLYNTVAGETESTGSSMAESLTTGGVQR